MTGIEGVTMTLVETPPIRPERILRIAMDEEALALIPTGTQWELFADRVAAEVKALVMALWMEKG